VRLGNNNEREQMHNGNEEEENANDILERRIELLQEEIKLLRELRTIDQAMLEKLRNFMLGGRSQ
jgi:hypothetical protein